MRHFPARLGHRLLVLRGIAAALLLTLASTARAQGTDADLVDRPIAEVRLVGLSRVGETEIRINIRTAPGQPYDPQTIRNDVNTLYRLGQFKTVDAEATLQADGSVILTYRFQEQAVIAEVQTVGNHVISDADLRAVIRLFRNAPRDDFLVEQAVRDIKDLYRERGHYLVDVEVDESRLADTGVLIFNIIEGPRVRIREIVFEGAKQINEGELYAQVKTRTYIFIFRKGQLDEDRLIDDVAAIDKYYKDHGFLDVRVDRTVEVSPDSKEAKVTFVIEEGPQYLVRDILVEGASPTGVKPLRVLAPEQIGAMLAIQRGDVLSEDRLRKSRKVVEDTYFLLGYVDARIESSYLRVGPEPQVDLVLTVIEGGRSRAGLVNIQGNFLTKDKIIRRETRYQPGRPIDGRELVETRERLERTRLFNNPIRITYQPPDPEQPDVRDVLIEVKERDTGSLNFGVLLGSDSGLAGEISLRQDNFDIADYPESFEEYIAGRAFRGAGQKFQISVSPGTEVSNYAISLSEPHLFESDIGARVGGFIRTRVYDEYDEDRLNLGFGLSRALGDIWSVSFNGTIEQVELNDIESQAPTVVFEDRGPNVLSSLGVSLARTTIDRFRRPSRGSHFELAFEQFGVFGGDFEFPLVRAEYTQYFTVDEDFLGRRSTLRFHTQASYIFNDSAPLYEKFYLGGRSFRGFEFRTISPKGIRNDNGQPSDQPIGGNWLFFAGLQYEVPIFSDAVTFVFFIDSGTVTDDVGFDDYRVTVGPGLRLYIPQFGNAPIAFDFGIPLLQLDTDSEQLFSFSAEVPF